MIAGTLFAEGAGVLERRTRSAAAIIWAYIGLSAVMAAIELTEFVQAAELEMDSSDPLSLAIAIFYVAYLLVFLASIVLIARWIHRAHTNLRLAGLDDLEYTPGWAVGWFFIPVMNLFKPFQAMRELWNASHGTSNAFAEESPASVKAWWGAYIVGNILSYVGMRVAAQGTANGYAVGSLVGAVGTLLGIIAAWYLLQVMREVLSGQRQFLEVSATFA